MCQWQTSRTGEPRPLVPSKWDVFYKNNKNLTYKHHSLRATDYLCVLVPFSFYNFCSKKVQQITCKFLRQFLCFSSILPTAQQVQHPDLQPGLALHCLPLKLSQKTRVFTATTALICTESRGLWFPFQFLCITQPQRWGFASPSLSPRCTTGI